MGEGGGADLISFKLPKIQLVATQLTHFEILVKEGQPRVGRQIVVLLPTRVGSVGGVVVAEPLVPPHLQHAVQEKRRVCGFLFIYY